ncbi:hypothetical protein CR513_41088, partial [Mucuna pruriens]
TRNSFKLNVPTTKALLVVYADVCGPMESISLGEKHRQWWRSNMADPSKFLEQMGVVNTPQMIFTPIFLLHIPDNIMEAMKGGIEP